MNFDPKTVKRYIQGSDYRMLESEEGETAEFVKSSDYDALLALYGQERQDRRDDAKQFQRDIRDAYAEGDYNARNDAGTY